MRASILFLPILLFYMSCSEQPKQNEPAQADLKVRQARSYAKHDYQMDTIYSRLGIEDVANDLQWKAAISPHDNYSFAGELYYKSLHGINAPNIILIGVAHRARNYDLQDKIIFGTFDQWQSPYGGINVSSLNEEIMSRLPEDNFIVHDSMQVIEHSLEALIPWIHRKNRSAEIVPILVPYISYAGIDSISANLALAVNGIIEDNNWVYGKDVAVVISNDAVHYGDQEWSNPDTMAPFGTDSAGTEQARQMDLEIIKTTLSDELTSDKIKTFTEYTVQQDDYKEYKWVWCGRYSVPFGLSFANKLNMLTDNEPLNGTFLGYQTSIDHEHVKIDDIGMTTSALTTNRHWVAYVSMVYE